MGRVRVIGGKYRSRLLEVVDLPGLRPTLDRVKETLFNWLNQDLSGQSCLDLFAGSGSLGFEAISRNAAKVVMVEKDARVAAKLRTNIRLLQAENCQIYQQSAFDFVQNCQLNFDIVFLDPPYQSDLLQKALILIQSRLSPGAKVYIEYLIEPDLTAYTVLKKAKAGKVNYALLSL